MLSLAYGLARQAALGGEMASVCVCERPRLVTAERDGYFIEDAI